MRAQWAEVEQICAPIPKHARLLLKRLKLVRAELLQRTIYAHRHAKPRSSLPIYHRTDRENEAGAVV